MKKKARLIAFYLPQYHPVEANDKFWGKGFTEWTNVTKAKPLYWGHQQPKLPADLGFYDLRVPEAREQQAMLAQEYGIEGFCYWHYWFGNGERVLEKIFNEVLASGQPDFPFCLGWANESWTGRWHGLDKQVIFEQKYPGTKDFEQHFYTVLPAFKDKRYIQINGKPVFMVYQPKQIKPNAQTFINLWNELAKKEGLDGIYFIGIENKWQPDEDGFDACTSTAPHFIKKAKNQFLFLLKTLLFNRLPLIYSYKKLMLLEKNRVLRKNEYPVVVTNWDNTPRSKYNGFILSNSTPENYKDWLNNAIDKVKDRNDDEKVVFLKSWNEWAEGNYLEPDRKLGLKYLEITKEVIFQKN